MCILAEYCKLPVLKKAGMRRHPDKICQAPIPLANTLLTSTHQPMFCCTAGIEKGAGVCRKRQLLAAVLCSPCFEDDPSASFQVRDCPVSI
jgi:hypothetical protein